MAVALPVNFIWPVPDAWFTVRSPVMWEWEIDCPAKLTGLGADTIALAVSGVTVTSRRGTGGRDSATTELTDQELTTQPHPGRHPIPGVDVTSNATNHEPHELRPDVLNVIIQRRRLGHGTSLVDG